MKLIRITNVKKGNSTIKFPIWEEEHLLIPFIENNGTLTPIRGGFFVTSTTTVYLN